MSADLTLHLASGRVFTTATDDFASVAFGASCEVMWTDPQKMSDAIAKMTAALADFERKRTNRTVRVLMLPEGQR